MLFLINKLVVPTLPDNIERIKLKATIATKKAKTENKS